MIARVGTSGRGLVQFWGVRATRSFNSQAPEQGWSAWEVESERRLHTVDIGDIRSVTNQKG